MIRSLLTILAIFIFSVGMAQTPTNYNQKWKNVDDLMKRGLTKSAIAEVEKINALAKKEKMEAQQVKALIYLVELEENIVEQGELKSFATLENALKLAKSPMKQILHSLLAGKYYNYFQQNRWRLYNRTPLTGTVENDVEIFGIEELHSKISYHYAQSLTEIPTLQTTSLSAYEPLIEKGNSRKLRPTLFDLLAHQALDYFRNDERDLKKPAYRFSIDNPAAFARAKQFVSTKFATNDTTSLYFSALLIYQQLLKFHLNDRDPAALLDADIERLSFMHAASTLENKDQLYYAALNELQKNYSSHPYGLLAAVIRLENQHQQAMNYQPGISDASGRFKLVEIKKELEKIIGKFPGTETDARAKNLLTSILAQHISAKTELVNLPGKPFLSLVEFTNLNAFYYRIIRLTGDENLVELPYQDKWKKLLSMKAEKQVRQDLPAANDHREHSVEIRIDALGVGEYALLCSTDEQFSIEKPQTVQFFHVSQISYINKGNNYFIVDRETGEPLSSAEVKFLEYKYDNKKSRMVYSQASTATTNSDGYLKMNMTATENRHTPYVLDISWKKDRLFTRNAVRYYVYNPTTNPEKERIFTAIFTDRSIYRPGQTVHFKGIMISSGGKNNSSVVPNKKTIVSLYDVNGQKKDSLAVTTNEFGSYQGKFRIPENLLTGMFSIGENSGSQVFFNVEEYKRPSFEIVFEQLKNSYRLNDTIAVTGTVSGYAGNKLNGAAVKYRVVRRTQIFPWLWEYKSWPMSREEIEITHGETMSDANGKFLIEFSAIPDADIDRKLDPSFHFEVIADVTDNSGETRSGTKSLNVLYKSVSLHLDMQDKYPVDSLRQIRVNATNLEGLAVAMNVNLRITELEAPARLLKSRLWEAPDTAIMSRNEFVSQFPNDPYLNETDPATWPRKKLVLQKTDSTGNIEINSSSLAPGNYLVEVSGKDKNGEDVKAMKYVKITSKSKPGPSYTWEPEGKLIAEPGETVVTSVGSSADKLFAILQIDKADDADDDHYKVINLSQRWYDISVPVSINDKGGFSVMYFFVKHNRFFQVIREIDVPWSDKKLDITVETFRNKLLPGSQETWKIKIKGHAGEKIAAELLTSMYDASLDQFAEHQWRFPQLFSKHISRPWNASSNFTTSNEDFYHGKEEYLSFTPKHYDRFIWNSVIVQEVMMMAPSAARNDDMVKMNNSTGLKEQKVALDSVGYGSTQSPEEKSKPGAPVNPRKNFNETAFFLPMLTTDENGNISFSFTMPESLTKWKWQMLAHSKDLANAALVKEAVTQKDLMVQPNMPRFLREGDKVRLTARVSNLTDKEISGQVFLQLIDPETGKSVDGWFRNYFHTEYFTVDAKQTTAVPFEIEVPANYNRPLQYRVLAESGIQTDGEENIIAVLPNRILVTESLPIIVKGNTSKNYQFKGLLSSSTSSTLTHQSLVTEYSTNPAWYAVLALPYLMEFPYECAEQNFNRYYANRLAAKTISSTPAIAKIFEQWKIVDTAALISNLLKNPELKNIILEQTPWVLAAASESEQRRNIALLFDITRLSKEQESSLSKLAAMQLGNGAFPWFKGGPDDRYITQYILTGIGRLSTLESKRSEGAITIESIAKNALAYADQKIKADYEQLIKNKSDLFQNNLGHTQVQYLYLRSFFKEPIPPSSKKAYEYYFSQAKKYWTGRNLMSQAMIALVMHRAKDLTASAILKSLTENSITTEEMGMYWKTNSTGYYWYQSPIEAQALAIEAFAEITKDEAAVENMKLWLLNQKRVQSWSSTKSTADAVYVLLRTGQHMLSQSPQARIQLGEKEIASASEKLEAGTGYFKTRIAGDFVKPSMGNINIQVEGNDKAGISWGAVHWQYFEDMDKVKSAATPVQVSRTFFIEKNTDKGPVLVPVKQGDQLKVGDKLKLRIQLRADRDMEYMHMKDLRASGTEPVNVISSYKWQGGLGYYEATRDASNDFFFSRLPKGTWVFEYPVFVTHAGEFAAGITTIQSMYAPEFNAHSEGIRIGVGGTAVK